MSRRGTRVLAAICIAVLVAVGGCAFLASRAADDLGSAFSTSLGPASPSWSPDGRKIAFQWDRKDAADHIWVVDVETGDLTKLTKQNRDNERPVWSPEGHRIAYTRLAESGVALYEVAVMDSGGLPLVRIAQLEPWAAPAWSRDGKQLIIESDGVVYAVPADGTGPRRKLPGRHSGELSPDAKWVVWDEGTNERYGIWIRAAAGGSETRIVPGAFDPTWSPDSKHIAFSKGVSEGIFVADVRGREVRRLPLPMDGGDLSWSPDGQRIAFVKNEVLYVVGIDGRGLRALAND